MILIKTIKKRLSKFVKKIKFFFIYSKNFSFKAKTNRKSIIIFFDGLFPHGGLVDRLKGIVSFYDISKQLDYDFKILFNDPFQLSRFLEPNQVDWPVKRETLKWNLGQTKLLYIVNDFKVNPLQIIQKSKAITFMVYANVNYSAKTFPDFNSNELETKWRVSFKELFKIGPLLEEKLKSIQAEHYIAFHARFTNLMGDFEDSSVKIISEKDKQNLLKELLDIIKRVLLKTNKPAYVFSDSLKFIAYIKAHTHIKTIEGSPIHMDNFKGTASIEDHLKTLMDFFMLSKSEKVYFLKAGNMHNSSFSKYASIIGDTEFERLEK